MPKIESEKPIYNVNRGHNSAIPRHYFSISTLIPSLKKIGKKMPKIESENKFLTSIKGYKLCTYLSKFTHLQSQNTPSQYIDSHTKFEENR